MTRLINPWPQLTAANGQPYDGASVYFGLANEDPVTNPKVPYADKDLADGNAIGSKQTLDDSGSFETEIFLKGFYSMSLFDKKGKFVKTVPEVEGSRDSSSKVFWAEDFDDFPTAVTAAAGGKLKISTDISVIANIALSGLLIEFITGGVLTVTTTKVITWDSPEMIEAPKRQKIFSVSESGAIVFSTAGSVWGGWWGCDASEASRAVNTAAFQFCGNVVVNMRGKMNLPGGIIKLDPTVITILVDQIGFSLWGDGSAWIGDNADTDTGTVLDFQGLTGSQFGLHIRNTSAPNAQYGETVIIRFLSIRGLTNQNVEFPTTTVKGLVIEDCARGIIKNVNVNKFHTGISADGTFLTTFDNNSCHECHYGLFLENANQQTKLHYQNSENNWIGIAIADGGGITIQTPQLESCRATGLYINPKNGLNIDDILLLNPYFESNLGTMVEVGTSVGEGRWATNGTITDIRWIGGRLDAVTLYPIFRNVTNLFLDIRQAYIAGNDGSGRENHFNFDSTVSWYMPTGGHYALGNSGSSASEQMLLIEFYWHINNTFGATHTLTLPDINIVPRNTPYTITRTDANLDSSLLTGFGGQLINSVTTIELTGIGATVTVVRDTVDTEQWRIIAGGPSGTESWDPPGVVSGTQQTKTVAVVGAAMGDAAIPSFSLDVQDLHLTANVTAADVVTLVLSNPGAGTIDLLAGTAGATVLKR